MKTFFKSFVESAREFRNLRSLITAALLVALHTVMALFLSIMVTESLRISISFIVNVVIGCLFGPVMGLVCGGLGDILQYLIKPTGPYFFGWTISAAFAGLIYGMFFYHKAPKTFPVFHSDRKRAEHEKNQALEQVQSQEKNQEGNAVEQIQKTAMTQISLIALYLLPAISLILSFTVPFILVVDKQTGASVVNGSAWQILCNTMSGSGSVNAAMIATMIMIASFALIVMNIWKLQGVSLILAVFCSFAAILSVYTDKKTTTALWGFWMIVTVMIIYIMLQIVLLSKKHRVDLSFLIRCIIALTLDTILVNILLGTGWVNVMYGKGFLFYLTSRAIKNLVQLPINIIITYYVLGFIKNIRKHI